jgi:hypothetical protein
MLLAETNGLKVVHVDISAADNTAVDLQAVGALGALVMPTQLVGAVVLESALGADANGKPHGVLGVKAIADGSTGIVSVTAHYSAALTARSIRVALLIKE